MPSPAPRPADRLVLTVHVRRLDGQNEVWLATARVGDASWLVSCASYGPTRKDAREPAIVRGLRAIADAVVCGTRPAPAAIEIVDAPTEEGR